MSMNVHSGNGVLLEAHGGDEHAVDYILGAQSQLNVVVYWQNQRGGNNVIAAGWVVRIDSQRIAFVGFGEFLSVYAAPGCIRPGIAEIPLKLNSCDLHLDGIAGSMVNLYF